jgi:hypothetical protein
MKDPRGNRNSGATIEARRAEVAAAVTGSEQVGMTNLAAALGVSRQTLWRDLQAIEGRYVEGSKDDVATFKKSQYDALMRIESATAEGSIPAEVANALVRVRDSVARLLGLNAPERSITATISADTSPMFLRFKKHCSGLSDEQLEQVYQFAQSLPRIRAEAARDASWFPAPEPKLLESE